MYHNDEGDDDGYFSILCKQWCRGGWWMVGGLGAAPESRGTGSSTHGQGGNGGRANKVLHLGGRSAIAKQRSKTQQINM